MSASGELRVDEGVIHYSVGPPGGWQLQLKDVALVGEFTTPDGPSADDYFVVFVDHDGNCFTAWFHAPGRDETLASFAASRGGEIRPALCNSTSWRSQVLWPLALKGQPLFDLFDTQPSSGGGKMLRAIGFARPQLALTPEVTTRLALRTTGG